MEISPNVNISYTEFILFSFPGISERRDLLTVPFLIVFIMILMSNSPIIFQIYAEPSLHSPMYILILSLLTASVAYIITIIPKMLLSFLGLRAISLTACLTQMFTIYFCILIESVIMLFMALDRFVAICEPLHYHKIVSKRLLLQLSAIGLLRNCAIAVPIVFLASRLQYCKSNVILHFFCENMMLLNLACGDISKVLNVGLLSRTAVTVTDITIISVSYLKVLYTAMKIAEGSARHKALHTCGTHLAVAVLLYSSGIISSLLYRSGASIPYDIQNLSNAIYILLPAIINPIIYGFRMSKIKNGLLRRWKKTRGGGGVVVSTVN